MAKKSLVNGRDDNDGRILQTRYRVTKETKSKLKLKQAVLFVEYP